MEQRNGLSGDAISMNCKSGSAQDMWFLAIEYLILIVNEIALIGEQNGHFW
jgi:hypothetical protein